MKTYNIFILLFSVIYITTQAQSKKQKDIQAIKGMQGCFKVAFNFAETFSYSKDSLYKPSKVKHDYGLEWAEIIEDSDDKISIQHLLIVPAGPNKHIVKHWRQDWLYENTDFYIYNANNQWRFVQKSKTDVKGQWTQKVYQVDDSPRYEGSSTWVHVDGKQYWENTTDAPLPRREITKRKDYNVTVRTNRHEITENGWVHNQDNDKVVREVGKEDFLLAQEKGYNTYTKVPDSECLAAQDWWKENKTLWANVRKDWNAVYAKNQNLQLAHKVDNKRLYEYLFALSPDTKNEEIETIITKFVK